MSKSLAYYLPLLKYVAYVYPSVMSENFEMMLKVKVNGPLPTRGRSNPAKYPKKITPDNQSDNRYHTRR